MISIDFSEEVKTIIGILVAILGGAAIRIIDRYLAAKSGAKENEVKVELRRELGERNDEIDDLQKDLNKWREKYWKEVSSHSETKTRLHILHETTDEKHVSESE